MRRAALLILRFYKALISPVLTALGVRCRHYPSCSDYTAQAVTRHGTWAGGWMGLARLLRCQPWGSSGIDEVPEERRGRWYAPWRYGRWRV